MRRQINTSSSTSVYISDSDKAELYFILRKFNLHNTIIENQWNIPTGIIGQIITDNLKIIIKPKINYLETVDYIGLLSNLGDSLDDVDGGFGHSENDLTNTIIKKFLISLKGVIKEGIPRKYVNRIVSTKNIIGNVDFVDTLIRRRTGIEPNVSTKIEVLESNHFEVQILKFAYEKLIKMSSKYKNPIISSALLHVKNQKIKNIDDAYLNFKIGSCNYREALKYATLIINSMNTARSKDDYSISMLFNGNKIFEDFIYYALCNNFKQDHFESQSSFIAAKSVNKVIDSRPDIIYKGTHDVVLDVKNKNFENSVTSSNFHQMLSYMMTIKVKTAILIYPYYKDEQEEMYSIVNFEDYRLYAVPINIKSSDNVFFYKNIERILRFN